MSIFKIANINQILTMLKLKKLNTVREIREIIYFSFLSSDQASSALKIHLDKIAVHTCNFCHNFAVKFGNYSTC